MYMLRWTNPGQGFSQAAIYCPPWVFDPDRDTQRQTSLFDMYTGPDVPLRGVAVVTYFRLPGGYNSLPKASDFDDEVNVVQMGSSLST